MADGMLCVHCGFQETAHLVFVEGEPACGKFEVAATLTPATGGNARPITDEEGHRAEAWEYWHGRANDAEAKLVVAVARAANAETLVAEANNSLFGSLGYFHSLNGGPFDKWHLSKAIEALKSSARKGAPFERLAQLRAAGWRVAVHNDYKLAGEDWTFWLFTHSNGSWVKGEGRTDSDALYSIPGNWHVVAEPEDKYKTALENIALLDQCDGHELTVQHAFEAVAIATRALGKHPSEIKRPPVERAPLDEKIAALPNNLKHVAELLRASIPAVPLRDGRVTYRPIFLAPDWQQLLTVLELVAALRSQPQTCPMCKRTREDWDCAEANCPMAAGPG